MTGKRGNLKSLGEYLETAGEVGVASFKGFRLLWELLLADDVSNQRGVLQVML